MVLESLVLMECRSACLVNCNDTLQICCDFCETHEFDLAVIINLCSYSWRKKDGDGCKVQMSGNSRMSLELVSSTSFLFC